MRRVREIWRFRELIRNLTRLNLLVKYRGSVLGVLWSLLHPMVLIGVYTLAFQYIIRLGLEDYSLFLLAGMLPWTFFSTTLVASTGSILGNASLLKKVQLPREVFPISTVAFFLIQLLIAIGVFGVFWALWKPEFSWLNLLYPVVLVLFVLFTAGLCLAFSAATVLYRDIKHFTEVGMLMLFWATPIIYDFGRIPEAWQPIWQVNPLTLFMNCFHDLVYWNRAPEPLVWVGVCVWPVLALVFGSLVFRRLDARFAEEV